MTEPTKTTTQPQSCREALAYFAAGHGRGVDAEDRADCQRLANFMTRRPFLGLIMQHAILHAYERSQGATDMNAEVNWVDVIGWLNDNLPAILKMLLSLLAIFGV